VCDFNFALMNNINDKINKFYEEEIINKIILSINDIDSLIYIYMTKECIVKKLEIDAYSICIGTQSIVNRLGANYLDNLSVDDIYSASSAVFLEIKIKQDYRYNLYYKMFENPIMVEDINICINPTNNVNQNIINNIITSFMINIICNNI
jgi:hypothetical protein